MNNHGSAGDRESSDELSSSFPFLIVREGKLGKVDLELYKNGGCCCQLSSLVMEAEIEEKVLGGRLKGAQNLKGEKGFAPRGEECNSEMQRGYQRFLGKALRLKVFQWSPESILGIKVGGLNSKNRGGVRGGL